MLKYSADESWVYTSVTREQPSLDDVSKPESGASGEHNDLEQWSRLVFSIISLNIKNSAHVFPINNAEL